MEERRTVLGWMDEQQRADAAIIDAGDPGTRSRGDDDGEPITKQRGDDDLAGYQAAISRSRGDDDGDETRGRGDDDLPPSTAVRGDEA